jgi:predicted phosphodiesterase
MSMRTRHRSLPHEKERHLRRDEIRRSSRAGVALAIACLNAVNVGCVRAPEERTERDETVGKGASSGISFDVRDGLAAIRRLEPGFLTLWAKAPTIQVEVSRTDAAPSSWIVTIDNALSSAILEIRHHDGTVTVAPETISGGPLTEKRWAVDLSQGATTLTLRPADGEPTEPWRFAVLSDVQEAIDRVQDIYARMNADARISFVVSAGDLTQRGTVEQLDRFERELRSLRVPFYPTLGNHELGTDDGAPFQRQFGRANFRFVYGGMQFTFLDSASATLDPTVYDWLDGWLREGQNRTHAVLMHIPPIDPIGVRNGSFANRNEAAKLLAKLAEGDVDVTLYGHIHSYYAFSNANIPAYISGGGGSIPERFDGIGRHYLTVDVDPLRGISQTGVVRIDLD